MHSVHSNKEITLLNCTLPDSSYYLSTSRVSGRSYKNGAICVSACVSECQLVNTLTAELIDLRSQNLVHQLTLMTSQVGLMVKVIGQRSRSPC